MFTLKIHCFPVLYCIMLFWEYHSASFCSYPMGCNIFSAPPPSTLLLFQSPGLPINILILKCLCTPLRNTQLALESSGCRKLRGPRTSRVPEGTDVAGPSGWRPALLSWESYLLFPFCCCHHFSTSRNK